MSTTEAILEKANALPLEMQQDVLEFVDSLAKKKAGAKPGEPGSALRSFAALNLDGENARDPK